ncbi:uncharacterized protein PAC_13215 [Phialocephala subalpina]|uniref:Uncharacterized protein n=1 Tax=Phialocephala subalpina TaxID=576137 RepID=A0A1L7XE80_9HELO|nr:uncharacterized protein PAC_13215 [Phialocephala subalpina]
MGTENTLTRPGQLHVLHIHGPEELIKTIDWDRGSRSVPTTRNAPTTRSVPTTRGCMSQFGVRISKAKPFMRLVLLVPIHKPRLFTMLLESKRLSRAFSKLNMLESLVALMAPMTNSLDTCKSFEETTAAARQNAPDRYGRLSNDRRPNPIQVESTLRISITVEQELRTRDSMGQRRQNQTSKQEQTIKQEGRQDPQHPNEKIKGHLASSSWYLYLPYEQTIVWTVQRRSKNGKSKQQEDLIQLNSQELPIP